MPINDATWQRFEQNLERANGLLNLHAYFVQHRRGRPPAPMSDLLRAATVFLHASMEEFFRSLAAQYWPESSGRVLNDIPLVSQGPATKFTLEALAAHRGKTIESVIHESIDAHLQNVSFSTTREVAGLLQGIGVDMQHIVSLFPELQELMDRRHHIVHRADRLDVRARGQHRTKSISVSQVNRWLVVVMLVAARITHQVNRSDWHAAELEVAPDERPNSALGGRAASTSPRRAASRRLHRALQMQASGVPLCPPARDYLSRVNL